MTKFYLGIDIGGTKIKAVLMRGLEKQKPAVFEIDTPKNKKDFLVALEELALKKIEQMVSEAGIDTWCRLSGIGVGVPGVVDIEKGILIEAPNLPFLNKWNVKKFFEKFCPVVKVENDAKCFLSAEMYWGAGAGYKNALGLTIGTGIGGGIFIDGKIYRGSNNAAGEFGHMIIENNHTFEFLGRKNSNLSVANRERVIGIGVANLVNILNPEIVILGGGSVAGNFISVEKIKKIAFKHMIYAASKEVKILSSELGFFSPAIGAGLLLK